MRTLTLLLLLVTNSPAFACDVLTVLPDDQNRGDLPASGYEVTGQPGPINWREMPGVHVEVEPTQTKRGLWCDWSRAVVEVRATVCDQSNDTYAECREPGKFCAIRRPSGHWDRDGRCIGWADVHLGDTLPRAGR